MTDVLRMCEDHDLADQSDREDLDAAYHEQGPRAATQVAEYFPRKFSNLPVEDVRLDTIVDGIAVADRSGDSDVTVFERTILYQVVQCHRERT